MKCPDCKGKLVEHTEGEKAGRGHCNACGICWAPEDLAKKVTRGASD
jgi:uncharacterized protein YbaR (Trm112 family)